MKQFMLLLFLVTLFSCKKDLYIDPRPKEKELFIDDFLNGQYNEKKRASAARLRGVAGQPFFKIPKALNVILLDFDGHIADSMSVWGYTVSGPAGFTDVERDSVLAKVRRYFYPFDVYVTDDERVFNLYVPKRRQRIVVTDTDFMRAGGVAYNNSRSWGADDEAYVFCALLYYNTKHVAGAIAHEVGHTMGLRHQATYENGIMLTQYSEGLTPDRSPVMGKDYNDPDGGEWLEFPVSLGTLSILRAFTAVHQNDKALLKSHEKLSIRKF